MVAGLWLKTRRTRLAASKRTSSTCEPTQFGEIDMRDLERRHVKAILTRWSDTPHAASHILIVEKTIWRSLGDSSPCHGCRCAC